jgi:predicted GNAT superfamily acetyltransferase
VIALSNDHKFNHKYFLAQLVLSLSQQKWLNCRKKNAVAFAVHMDNSTRHNARKSNLEWEHNRIERVLTPLILQALAGVIFGFLVASMKN